MIAVKTLKTLELTGIEGGRGVGVGSCDLRLVLLKMG